ncbi:hypothetical protein [Stenotrophomonas maltophilia group sp. RNC7]|uniref:hypothetical protein n=1 Tax=Stenotrophomonas maltophilia group sp. RNC7 TaxID=3071467 RepID=UPI0027DF02FC|nr:hypothetical protein [Stenotrophomonas maltophilia group sp. RNC7]MDQ4680262.1 hypothetical protein [Stenotrophomonas maltophilia group sp. RNC7]
MDELKKEYNELLKRYFKAMTWFENSVRTTAEQSQYLGLFKQILKDIIRVTLELKKHGVVIQDGQYLKGFQ